MFKKLTILLILTFGFSAFSAELTVRKINRARTEALISTSEDLNLQAGDHLDLTPSCSTQVMRSSSNQLIVNLELCEDPSSLVVGRKLSDLPRRARAMPDEVKHPISESTAERYRRRSAFADGVQLGIEKNFFSGTIGVSAGGQSASLTGDVEQSIGLRIGYASIPVGVVGFQGTTGIDFYSTGNGITSIPLEALATYGVNENFAFGGGLKLEDFNGGGSSQSLGFGYGVKVAAMVQATANIGGEISYDYTHHSQSIDGTTITVDMSGLALGLKFTF